MRRVLVLVACAAVLTAGCGDRQPGPSASGPGAAASTAPQTVRPATPPPPTVTLAFGGDVHFAERTLDLLADPASAFGPVASIFQEADLAMVNLETAVTERGTPEPKQFHFRAPATTFDAVKAAGVDVVSLANNHTLDYGQVGLADTLAAAHTARVPVVGAGIHAGAAYAPWVTHAGGVRIAVLGFTQITELADAWVATDTRPGLAMAISEEQIARAASAVRQAREVADVVVVYMHWGQEYNECPIALQRTAATALAEAGATVIVGTHAHVLQGGGWLGRTYVAYGLSNFVWWYNDAASNDTGVLRVTVTGSTITSVEFVPAYIDRVTGQPIPSSGDEAARISAKYEALHACTGLSASPS